MVNYQIFMGKFCENFKDLTNKISYLKYLGINNIWITPYLESPSYHGYDTKDYYNIKSNYGTMEDFEECINHLKNSNIGIIMDLVLCHTSDKHEWFKKAEEGIYPYKNFYIWSDVKTELQGYQSCNDQSTNQLGWYWSDKANKYYRAEFGYNMPSLNLENPELRKEIKNIVRFWISKGVIGFRLDAVLHSHGNDIEASLRFWSWFRLVVLKINPNIQLIGECWTEENLVGRYAQAIGSCFQFSTKDSLIYGINNNCMREIPNWIKLNNNQSDFSNSMMGIFLCNHDTNRIASELNNNINKLIYSAAFLLTLKGIPYIYYGDEIGVDGVKWYGDEGVRTDIAQYNHNFKLFNTYKDLIEIRNGSNALTYGDFIPMWSSNNNAAYFIRRFYNEEIHIIISGEKNVKINLQHGSFLVLYGSNKGNVVDLCENSNFNEGVTILKRL